MITTPEDIVASQTAKDQATHLADALNLVFGKNWEPDHRLVDGEWLIQAKSKGKVIVREVVNEGDVSYEAFFFPYDTRRLAEGATIFQALSSMRDVWTQELLSYQDRVNEINKSMGYY